MSTSWILTCSMEFAKSLFYIGVTICHTERHDQEGQGYIARWYIVEVRGNEATKYLPCLIRNSRLYIIVYIFQSIEILHLFICLYERGMEEEGKTERDRVRKERDRTVILQMQKSNTTTRNCLFYHTCPVDQPQFIKLSSKCFYLLNHFACLLFTYILNTNKAL